MVKIAYSDDLPEISQCMGNASSALMIDFTDLQLLIHIRVRFLHPYQHCLAIMGIKGAATDKLFSNPMVKHL